MFEASEGTLALCVALVTFVFAIIVARDWATKRRPALASWAVALVMASIASWCYAFFVFDGRQIFLFRMYYLFGAALNVAFLGLGSLYLSVRRPLAPLLLLLVDLSIVTAWQLFVAPYDAAALAHTTGAGTDVLLPGPWLPLLIVLNTFGTVCLVGVAIVSAWQTSRRHAPVARTAANAVIAAGALVIALAGTIARVGGGGAFWLTMLAGWCVLFGGFLLASRRASPTPTPQAVRPFIAAPPIGQ